VQWSRAIKALLFFKKNFKKGIDYWVSIAYTILVKLIKQNLKGADK
jgi:hypothetical protein